MPDPMPIAQPSRPRPRLTRLQRAGLVIGAVVFAVPWFVDFADLSPEGHRMLSIFLLAVVLWVTEAIPLHATAAVIIALEIAVVSDQALIGTSSGFDAPGYESFYQSLAHPVLILFLGGFFLADGAAKFALDRNLARVLLRPFGTSPRRIVLGVMLITAGLSMFMSNTAITATMMAVMLPVLVAIPADDPLRRGMTLCIPVAANIGGLGTPVGSPPNAIALGNIRDAGIDLTFVEWMAITLPFAVVVLFGAWLLLMRLFPSRQATLTVEIPSSFDRTRPALLFYVTAAVTVGLWLTEPVHGVDANVVGFLPIVVLLATRVFGADDLRNVQWDVLWLVAGGIALGSGVSTTGLDVWLVGLVAWESLPALVLVAALALGALALSTTISHSAAANLLVPIGITLAAGTAVDLDPALAGVIIAVGCSLAMALPISTPPNAVAYSTGMVSTRDMALSGVIIGLTGLALYVLAGPPLWRYLGLVG
jgi:sodium-dependent dicarboxylate transporter 2/3/5